MSELERLQAEVRKANIQLAAIAMQTEAAQSSFNHASFLAHGEELDNIRAQLHALLDNRLDYLARVMQLTRQMVELPPT